MTDALSDWDRHVGHAAAPAHDVVLPVEPHPLAEQKRPKQLLEWLEKKRALSAETVALFGVYIRPHRFQALAGADAQPAIVMPYLVGGKLVNRGYRLTEADVTEYEGAALPSLFNVDAVDAEDPQEVVIVQRELDVLAMHEAGYPQAVCLPQLPRPQDLAAGQEDRRFRPLATHEQLLQKVRRFVLAMDASPAGIEMREELARRLGRHRCRLVQWPEPITSAGEALSKTGKEGLFTAIQQAEAYPLEGVHRITVQAMLDLRDQAPPPVMKGGIGPLDAKVSFPTDGRLILVSGIPNHGKTPVVRHLMMHQMEHYDRKWAVFSPEERPWQRFAATCAQWLIGKPFWPSQKHGGLLAMDRQEIIMAAQWLSRRLYMIVGDAERDMPTVDWLLARAADLVLAEGVTDVWIDPWNEIAHSRAAAREDEYLRETLMRLQAFSARHGTNWWVNVHPITMRPKPGEKIQAPGPYDISGGSMWFNKADLMLVVHRPADQPLTEIHVRKAKHPAYGRRGDMVEIAYDQTTGRYTTPTG